MTAAREVADVAVVLAAYNAAHVLETALASVASQTVAPAQLVVVDDGSVDAPLAVCRRWADLLPLTFVPLPTNAGLSSARRAGVEATDAQFIALLDADDAWLPDHLELMTGLYRQRGGLISANAYRWVPGRHLERRRYRDIRSIPPPDEQPRAILRGNFVFGGVLFARADYDAVGGFRPGIRAAEDWDLWIRMLRSGVRVSGVGQPTVLYRINPGSISASAAMLPGMIAVVELAAAEGHTAVERSEARRSARRLRAVADLYRAMDLAESGSASEARSTSLRAVGAGGRTTVKALMMTVAPGSFMRLRRMRLEEADGWLAADRPRLSPTLGEGTVLDAGGRGGA